MAMTERRAAEADLWGYHQNWYAVALSEEVGEGSLLARTSLAEGS